MKICLSCTLDLYISMASFDGIRKKSFELLLQIISQILKSIGELLHYPSEKVQ